MGKSWFLSLLLGAVMCLTNLSAQSQCSVVGWASQNGGVTGGGTATATVVTNYDELKAAITSSSVKVVHISGTITIPSSGRISFQDQSGKTIYGLPGSKLVSTNLTKDGSGILYVKRCSNIILKNITFEGPGAYDADGWDNVTLDNSTNIWVDHCEFQDGMDGNFDIKNAADYITVTWCRFIYKKAPIAGGSGGSDDHRFSDLFGSSDATTTDRGTLRITMQHCWWAQGCKARMPRVRFGKVHVVNNLFNSTVAAQCVMAGFEADLLVESNVFENVKSPIDPMDNTFTAITARNNIFTNTTGGDTTGSGTSFIPPYTLNLTPAANVKSKVTASAGATLTSPSCDTDTSVTPVTYTLSTTAVPTAGGTVTGAGTYDSGKIVMVTAIPATGYTFTGWSGARSDTSLSVTLTMNSNKSVTANFQAQGTGGSSTIRIEDDATTQGLCSYEGAISSNSGASNGKVINLGNSTGKGVDWKVNAPEAGTYTLTWRYVNSSSNAQTMGLLVNGVTINSALPFAETSGSTAFTTSSTTVSLNVGVNNIRLQSVSSTATADIDWIEISGNEPSVATCPGDTALITAVTDPNQVFSQKSISIYPNPAKGNATVTVILKRNEQAVITVYDALGKMVEHLGTISSLTGDTQQIQWNVSSKTPGLYNVLMVSNKGSKHSCKLIIQ